MEGITENEMGVVLRIFRDIKTDYNANNLSKRIGLSSMGTLNILKGLERKGTLRSKQMGNATFYKISFNEYSKSYLRFILQKESEESLPKVKAWIKELRKLESLADIGILFGSVIKGKESNDIDVLLVLDGVKSREINQKVEEIKKINLKYLHTVMQTKVDIERNLSSGDRVLLNILETGLVAFGYEKLIGVVENATLEKNGWMVPEKGGERTK